MDELYQEHIFFVREQLQELELRYVVLLRDQICNEIYIYTNGLQTHIAAKQISFNHLFNAGELGRLFEYFNSFLSTEYVFPMFFFS